MKMTYIPDIIYIMADIISSFRSDIFWTGREYGAHMGGLEYGTRRLRFPHELILLLIDGDISKNGVSFTEEYEA